MNSQKKRKKRDISLFIILAILLLIPLAIDEAFVRLKVLLRATTSGPVAGESTRASGRKPATHIECRGGQCHPMPGQAQDAGQGLQGGASGIYSGTASNHAGGAGLSGLEALAQFERQQLDNFNQLVRSRYGRRDGEVWVPIEPGPSNPSRFFPELPKPRLSSGVALTTGPDERREPEVRRENEWGKGSPVKEVRRENDWGKGSPVKEERRENNWGKGSPVKEERRENNWGAGNPAPVVAKTQKPLFYPKPEPEAEPEAPRMVFQAPPKVRPTEQARSEKLLEVCGRMVPISRAATASLECAPQPAPQPSRKPASEHMDEGGDEKIFMP